MVAHDRTFFGMPLKIKTDHKVLSLRLAEMKKITKTPKTEHIRGKKISGLSSIC